MQEKKTHKTSVGGQALIEGIMMQGPKGMATAVRKPDGDILTDTTNSTVCERNISFWVGRWYAAP